jgi:8-oxo-dGTP pyrophosphatase MutT (NUDIX family)
VPKILSAGVVVVRGEEAQRRYLLLRAYRNWDFPKGMVEAGEDPLQAAIREVEEETSITDLKFHWGYDYRETPPYARGKVARYYVAETMRSEIHLPVNPELGRPEHDEYLWVDQVVAQRLLVPRLQSILAWAVERSTSTHPDKDDG